MPKQHDGYKVIPFSEGRQIVSAVMKLGEQKHIIHGLVEVDVTMVRHFIREYEAATGTDISFTAFIITCLGKAVSMNERVHAYRKGGSQLVLFDDVDVNIAIEREVNGEKVPLTYIIRAANKKEYHRINQEIQKAQAKIPESQTAATQNPNFIWALPSFIKRMVFQWGFSSPHRIKANAGTVFLTAVGMFGNGGGWGIPYSCHTLVVTLGGIAEKPVVVDGKIEIREMLSVTVSFDHDIVDGAPAARFTSQLKGLIESGYGLVEQEAANPRRLTHTPQRNRMVLSTDN
jgi:pyruvate/2-oxoglutarate dehydrogenase complex dihydrolipoamide acyltransferase (E2) component